jgi:hypothetical protein
MASSVMASSVMASAVLGYRVSIGLMINEGIRVGSYSIACKHHHPLHLVLTFFSNGYRT